MRTDKLLFLSIVVSLTLFASNTGNGMFLKEKKESEDIAKAVKTGKEASSFLMKTLGGKMKEHMKSGGPKEALKFCSENAARLTADVNEKFGKNVNVKRVTLKPRNPANLAENDEKEVLEALEILKKNGVKLPKYLIQKSTGGYKFYKPLKINKRVCLKCHGSSIGADLLGYIKKIYPTDSATGYKMGDLRGAVVVTIGN